jgi:predicted CoA-binding protein
MDDAEQVLRAAHSVVVVDWPSRDVPETLTRAGYSVAVKSGPDPDDYTVWALGDGAVSTRADRRPDRADLVYTHRPLAELPGIVELARRLGAAAVWLQSGRAEGGQPDPHGCWLPAYEAGQAREVVERAGLQYVGDRYIADVARGLGAAPA